MLASFTPAAASAPVAGEPAHDRAFWLALRAQKFRLPESELARNVVENAQLNALIGFEPDLDADSLPPAARTVRAALRVLRAAPR